MATLNTTNSIVDYLSLQGKDSSFTARKNLYNSLGLDKRLGEYTGSSSQNTNFLNSLKTPAQPVLPGVMAPQPTASVSSMNVNPVSPTPVPAPAGSAKLPGVTYQPANAANSSMNINPVQPIPGIVKQAMPVSPPASSANSSMNVNPVQPFPQATPTDIMSTITQKAASATGAMAPQATPPATPQDSPILGSLPSTPSEGDILTSYMNSSDYQMLIDQYNSGTLSAEAATAAAKDALERKYASDKKSLEDNLASRGLFLSGMRSTQIAGLLEELGASKLGLDRELASTLMNADMSLRKSIMSDISGLIKSAADDNKDAIDQLNKAGFAVVGDKLYPTLEAMKAEASAAGDNLYMSTDSNGIVTAVDKSTGQTIWQAAIGKAGSDNAGTNYAGSAGDFYTKTQIADGAANAGLSLAEFASLPVDQASQYVQGTQSPQVLEQSTKDNIAKIKAVATQKGEDAATTAKNIRTLIAASGLDPDTFDNGAYKQTGFWEGIGNFFGF